MNHVLKKIIFLFLVPIAVRAQTPNTNNSNGLYVNLKLSINQLFNNYPIHSASAEIPYYTTDINGITQAAGLNSVWTPSRMFQNPWGSQLNLEVGKYKYFINLGVGGYETMATNFTIGPGFNFYIPIKCNSKPVCLVIKPSLNFGIEESFPFNQGGNSDYQIGSIDNENKTIDLFGYTFNPTYTVAATKYQAAYTSNAKSLDFYFMQNNTFLFPKISIGKNNFERLFYFSADVGYYFPLHTKQGIQLFQDQNYSGKTIWLNDNSDGFNYNGQPITSMPSILNGLYIGISVGLNFSREIFETYGTNNLRKHSPDYGNVCHCYRQKTMVNKTKKPKKSKKETKKETKKKMPNTRGW